MNSDSSDVRVIHRMYLALPDVLNNDLEDWSTVSVSKIKVSISTGPHGRLETVEERRFRFRSWISRDMVLLW